MLKRGLANRVVDEQHCERFFSRGSLLQMLALTDDAKFDANCVTDILARASSKLMNPTAPSKTADPEKAIPADGIAWLPRDVLMQQVLYLMSHTRIRHSIFQHMQQVSHAPLAGVAEFSIELMWQWFSNVEFSQDDYNPGDPELLDVSCRKPKGTSPQRRLALMSHLLHTLKSLQQKIRPVIITYSEPELLLMEVEALKVSEGLSLLVFHAVLLIESYAEERKLALQQYDAEVRQLVVHERHYPLGDGRQSMQQVADANHTMSLSSMASYSGMQLLPSDTIRNSPLALEASNRIASQNLGNFLKFTDGFLASNQLFKDCPSVQERESELGPYCTLLVDQMSRTIGPDMQFFSQRLAANSQPNLVPPSLTLDVQLSHLTKRKHGARWSTFSTFITSPLPNCIELSESFANVCKLIIRCPITTFKMRSSLFKWSRNRPNSNNVPTSSPTIPNSLGRGRYQSYHQACLNPNQSILSTWSISSIHNQQLHLVPPSPLRNPRHLKRYPPKLYNSTAHLNRLLLKQIHSRTQVRHNQSRLSLGL